ncbi:hypothetical protein BB8028_0004g00510 [Beauveria bassiana]|uniref:Alcohol acetyltransferase n=1 Tax=Beauveria bassiana TaxID=176275 RepID=A0A2S7YAT3_BEABA|nr:hypothetical protein BB8028_0004g00510 [Beauveria bassiana]
MASEPSLRRLGPMELYSSSRHHLGIYRAVCISARYVPRSCIAGPSSPRFIAALAAVVRAHPMLRVGIAGEHSNAACYTHISRINLQEHIHLVPGQCESEEQLNSEVARVQAAQHNHLWQSTATKPPWRVTIIQDQDRDCYDRSSLPLAPPRRSFLNSASAAAKNDPLLSFPDPPVLPDPQEDAVAFTLSPLYMASVLWGEFAPAMLKPAPRYPWGGERIDFARPHVTRIRAVDIPPQQTKVLLAACRANDTTLTGLLHALALAYFSTTLPEHAAAPGFCGATPMGLRSHARDASPTDALRVLLCSTEHFFSGDDVAAVRAAAAAAAADSTLTTAVVWATAARVRRELATRSKTLTHNNVAALMKHVSDWGEFHARRDGTARTLSWEVSNVGVLGQTAAAAGGDDAEARISRILFSNGAMVTGAAVAINVASAGQGQLGIALSWQEGVVEESLIEGLGRMLERGAERFCSTGRWVFRKDEIDEMDVADTTNKEDRQDRQDGVESAHH